MKKNIFWTIWGVVSLVCVMIAGFKGFAIELEKKTEDSRPKYLTSEQTQYMPTSNSR